MTQPINRLVEFWPQPIADAIRHDHEAADFREALEDYDRAIDDEANDGR